jgi:hypothetical protein
MMIVSYESRFCTYMTWLDEDVWAGAVLAVSMEDRFAVDIIELDRTYQM